MRTYKNPILYADYSDPDVVAGGGGLLYGILLLYIYSGGSCFIHPEIWFTGS